MLLFRNSSPKKIHSWILIVDGILCEKCFANKPVRRLPWQFTFRCDVCIVISFILIYRMEFFCFSVESDSYVSMTLRMHHRVNSRKTLFASFCWKKEFRKIPAIAFYREKLLKIKFIIETWRSRAYKYPFHSSCFWSVFIIHDDRINNRK